MSQNEILGTEENDILTDTLLDDQIFALGGDDQIETSLGNDLVDGGEGNDKLIINYSTSSEDLSLYLQNYYFNSISNDGSLEINFLLTNNYNHLDFYSIESFVFNSGSGNDNIELGYDNYSDDQVNAGEGNDFIFTGLGNDTIDGGSGFDILRLDFSQSQTPNQSGVVSFLNNSHSGQYSDGINTVSFTNIEAVEVFGSYYDDVLVAVNGNSLDEPGVYPMNSIIDGKEGFDQLVADYSERTEDLMFTLNGYGDSGSVDVNSYITEYNSRIDFNSIESFVFNSGSGNDNIELGYNNNSDDQVNAGAGDDFIFTGLGKDTIDGGSGFDFLRLDFSQSQSGVVSFLSNGDSGQYSDGINTLNFTNIETVNVFGSSFDDVLVALNGDSVNESVIYPMSSMIDGQHGFDQLVADYSERTEDLNYMLNSDGAGNGSLEVVCYMSEYNSRIDFNNIESFALNTGSGNDNIDLVGYNNYENSSNDEVNAGGGNDFIFTGLGNDTIDGGAGFDILHLDFSDSQSGIVSFLTNNHSGQYSDGLNTISFSNIEVVDVFGSYYDDVLVALNGDSLAEPEIYPMFSIIDGQGGDDQLVADYSERTENLNFILNSYSYEDGLLEVNSYTSGYNSQIEFNSIESFVFNTGSGNDNIDLGYSNISQILVNAGGGDDFISVGSGSDTINGGSGNDTFVYQLGAGVDIISDSSGDSDTIVLGSGITLDNLNIEVNDSDLIFSFNDSPDDQLVLENYVDSNDKIENVEIDGQILTFEELLELKSIPDVVNDLSGNDFITANLDDGEVNGGAGYDVLMVDFYQSPSNIVSFLDNSHSGQYTDGINSLSFRNFEAVQVFGSNYDDILVALNAENYDNYEPTSSYPLASFIDGGEGNDQLVADYSQQPEDLMFMVNNHNDSGSIDVHSNTNNYNSRIDFNNIESFALNSGNGNDNIDLGYDNISDDQVNAGAGDDFISTGLGNDTIDGGAGFDVLRLDFSPSQTGVSSFLSDSNSGQYSDGINTVSFSNIEAVEIFGSYYDDVLVAVTGDHDNELTTYPMNSWVNGFEGEDQLVVDYSEHSEDLTFNFNNYSDSGSIEVYSNTSNYNSRIDFNSIESFALNSGNGNDWIELGYDNISDDQVNAGAGDDFISTGLGNDTIDGGAGFDVLRLDFSPSQTGVSSFLNDDNSGQYSDGINTITFSNIEAVEILGSIYDDVLVTFSSEEINGTNPYPMNSMIDGGEGNDQLVADYSEQTEDLMFTLNSYGGSGSLNVNSYTTGYNSLTDVNSVESFAINSGSGNDFIDLGYNYYSDDVINAGGGDDVIVPGLGNDTIDGGDGNDTYIYEPGQGSDVISDLGGENDTIMLNGISPYDFVLNVNEQDLIFNFHNFPGEQLIIKDYFNSPDSIENIDVQGQIFSIPPVTVIDGGTQGDHLGIDYSDYTEDLNFMLNDYTGSPSLEINSYMTNYYSQIGIDNVGSFAINSGSGNDFIDLGYNYYSDDLINAGAGDDVIVAGLGNDTIDGGDGNDTYFYEPGQGSDVISDLGGENDTIMLNGISPYDFVLNVNEQDLIFNFHNFPGEQLIIKDYFNSPDSIENIDVAGQIFSLEEILAPKTIGEFGKISNFNHNSQTIQLDNSYENPVVFALPLSRNGGDPAVVRITDIQNDNFAAYVQEAEYKDGYHTDESFSYLVLEAGTWELDNGDLLEVGTVDTNLVTTEGWENIDFNADFADTPVILSQVQTNQDSQFVRTRQNQASIDRFSLSLEEEESLKTSGHASETVGWLAIDSGQGNWGELEYQAGSTGREVTHQTYNLNFSQDFANEPYLFASLASFYGGDSAGLRYKNLNDTQVQIMVEEDQSFDSETGHTKEIVDFLAISGTGDLTATTYGSIDLIDLI